MAAISMDSIHFYQTSFLGGNCNTLYVNHTPRHKTWTQLLESVGTTFLDGASDFESQHNPSGNQDTIDVYLPTLEELLLPR
jgi:hypothetical protein